MLEGLSCSSLPTPSGDKPLLALELDCCVLPLRNNFKLIQTTDFFYPLIDDPYTMGWITCCNVLSDLYAMGVVNCDNMLLLLGVPQGMSITEREVCVKLLMEGFRDCAVEANTSIRGGQTVISPWLMIGGVATSVCDDSEYIMPNRAEEGDVLVLTKPLGTQVAVNLYQWMLDEHKFWSENLQNITTADEVRNLFDAATMSMTHLNRTAARLMHKYDAHGSTDVTGFGLLGHANNLAKFQSKPDIAFELHTLPCLAGTIRFSKALNDRFKLMRGLCPETSGGLLIVLAKDRAQRFCDELTELERCPAWIVGDVVKGTERGAYLIAEPRIVEVEYSSIAYPRRNT